MSQSTVVMLRAYLATASLAAALVGGVAVAISIVFNVGDAVFESASFRLGATAMVVFLVLLAKRAGLLAFRSALENRHVVYHDPQREAVAVSSGCPLRWLVVLHLLFHGKAFALAD